MKTLAILQARMSSRRLPGKVMKIVNDKPMIGWQIARINSTKSINKLVIATSNDQTDLILSNYLEKENHAVHRGSLVDVHSRFYEIIESNPGFEIVVRLTGDCPFVMPDIVDSVVAHLVENNLDYVCNTNPPTYPDGLDVEAFTSDAFLRMSNLELNSSDLEHVTLKFRTNPEEFALGNIQNNTNLSSHRWTVDYPQDLNFVRGIFKKFSGRECEFSVQEVLDLLILHPELNNQLTGTLRNVSLNNLEDDFN